MRTVRPKYDECMAKYRDAAALWGLRTAAAKLPQYGVPELRTMEDKLLTHVNALLVLPETSWEVALHVLTHEELTGGLFIASVLAFRSYDQARIKQVVDLAVNDCQSMTELVSAFGWLPGDVCESWIARLHSSKELAHKYIAIAACSVRRRNPGDALVNVLTRDDCKNTPSLFARGLRLVGELKRQDLKRHVLDACDHHDDTVRFWAIWSLMLLGEHYRADALKPFVMSSGSFQGRAIDMAFRVLPGAAARQWIAELTRRDASHHRAVIRAIAALGDPKGINWLLAQMRDLRLARPAAEAFYHITGISIVEQRLAMDVPDLTAMVPRDGVRASVNGKEDLLPEEDSLPWPDVDKVSAVWLKYGDGFRAGQRYFLGERLARDHLQRALRDGTQRLRYSAALELSLQDSYAPLENVSAWHLSG